MIDDALRTHILGDATISGLIGTRLYPQMAPHDVTRPFMVYERTATDRLRSHDGPSGLSEAVFAYNLFDTRFSGVKALADALRKRLDGFTGTVSGVDIRAVFVEDESDVFEAPSDASDRPLRGITMIVRAWYVET